MSDNTHPYDEFDAKAAEYQRQQALRPKWYDKPDEPEPDIRELLQALLQRLTALEAEVATLKQQKTPAISDKQIRSTIPLGTTKFEFQLFENFRKPKEQRPMTQALAQIKVYAWAPNKVKGYWLIPVHRPDRTDGRKRLADLMPTINQMGCDKICYAGQLGDLQVYIGHGRNLIALWGGEIFQANPPVGKPTDAADNAPMYHWTCDLIPAAVTD